MRRISVPFSLALLVCALHAVAAAQRPFRLQQGYYSGLSSPVFLTNAGDGSRRIFVVEQAGTVKVVQPGSTAFTTYLTRSVSCCGERGLLGLAFHPQFGTNRRLFIYYTRSGDGAIEIAEYEQNAQNSNTANFVRVIISIPHPGATNHNGGTIAFGPDGFLYAGTGDGGSGNDPNNNAQNINSLLGKMLRLDINTPNGQTPAYNIPSDNPYVGVAGADEIYAIGLRNPYRFSFDRGGTNQLWVADVGQNALEEVSIVTRGGNYGWRVYEGNQCTNIDQQLCAGGSSPITHSPPLFTYGRVRDPSDTANRCSITGGYVYRGKQNALVPGSYVYGDYCTGEILLWNGISQQILRDTSNNNLVAFGQDEDGEIYVVRQHANFAQNTGSVDKIAGVKTNGDFDGDGDTDPTVFRPDSGTWYSLNLATGNWTGTRWGVANDIPVSDDFDGDGRSDIAVFRPSNGTWYIVRSADSTFDFRSWGVGTDTPTPGDFDGDGRADLVVYRPASGDWWVLRSIDGNYFSFRWGVATDVPVNGDVSGDGIDDFVVYRPSSGSWYAHISGTQDWFERRWGVAEDIPVLADYDGDARADFAVYRPSQGAWFIWRSSDDEIRTEYWGVGSDIPVPGDYDRDNRDDVAIFRPGQGVWYIFRSSDRMMASPYWGFSGDKPIPVTDRP